MNDEPDLQEISPDAPLDGGTIPDQYVPPEVALFRPQAGNVIKPGDGTVQLEFMISPLKVVALIFPEEAARELAAQINGGIVVPQGMPRMDVPKGRRPQ